MQNFNNISNQHSIQFQRAFPSRRIKKDPYKSIKICIWAYFLLLIFEGALRRWVLPSLATPIMVIRDPIAVYAIFLAIRKNILPQNPFMTIVVFIGILSTLLAMIVGHGNFIVAVYGARILVVHFPLMFVIGRVFSRQEVLKMGVITLWIAIPMTVLIALQFYSPQTAWVNKGIGLDEGSAGFEGALGFFRPPGTFSFTNGNTLFYSFLAPFVFFFAIDNKGPNRLLVWAAVIALIIAIPLSISRALFFQVLLTVFFVIIAVSRKPKYLGKLIMAGLGLVIVVIALSNTSFFQLGTNVFTSRFETANEAEGGLEGVLLDRFLGGLISAITSKSNRPFFGGGIGIGTNVGAMLISGKMRFMVGEGEWFRVIGELGFLLGITLIFARVAFAFKLLYNAYKKLVKGDLLPWLLASFGFITVAQGLWAQPTALGFSTLIGGLMIASLKKSA